MNINMLAISMWKISSNKHQTKRVPYSYIYRVSQKNKSEFLLNPIPYWLFNKPEVMGGADLPPLAI